VSNETGAVNDIAEIARIAKKKNPDCIVHSDGVQGFKKASLNLLKSEIDLYSISGHKIHAPKGIGALYVKKGLNLRAFIHGGGQENNIRSATENVAGIAAFSLAADLISKKIIDKNLLRGLRDALTENFDVKINTPSEDIDRILSVAFRGIRGEVLLHSLEKHGIIVGTGSACSSQKGGTRIADALGLPKEYGAGILRISINENTSREEIGFFLEKLTLEYCNLLNYIG
jgi:cysteine desulfurase